MATKRVSEIKTPDGFSLDPKRSKKFPSPKKILKGLIGFLDRWGRNQDGSLTLDPDHVRSFSESLSQAHNAIRPNERASTAAASALVTVVLYERYRRMEYVGDNFDRDNAKVTTSNLHEIIGKNEKDTSSVLATILKEGFMEAVRGDENGQNKELVLTPLGGVRVRAAIDDWCRGKSGARFDMTQWKKKNS